QDTRATARASRKRISSADCLSGPRRPRRQRRLLRSRRANPAGRTASTSVGVVGGSALVYVPIRRTCLPTRRGAGVPNFARSERDGSSTQLASAFEKRGHLAEEKLRQWFTHYATGSDKDKHELNAFTECIARTLLKQHESLSAPVDFGDPVEGVAFTL